MKKCLICEKEVLEKREEICETCLEFLKSKYGSKTDREIQRFRESRKFINKWRSSEKEVGEK